MRNGLFLRKMVGLLGVFCLLMTMISAYPAKQPKIKFKALSHNFGKVKQGEVLSYEFVFTNEGDGILSVQRVATSCGCTAALVSEDKVAPGKEGRISVKFDTRGYGGPSNKQVFVDSNDPAEPHKQLEILADIEVPPSPKIDLDPYNIDAGLALEGEELSAPVKIINRGELELKAEFTHRSASFLINRNKAPSPLKVASGKTVEVEIRIPTQGRIGQVREYVLIKSNDPIRSTLSITLSGYIITKQQLKELFAKYKNILN